MKMSTLVESGQQLFWKQPRGPKSSSQLLWSQPIICLLILNSPLDFQDFKEYFSILTSSIFQQANSSAESKHVVLIPSTSHLPLCPHLPPWISQKSPFSASCVDRRSWWQTKRNENGWILIGSQNCVIHKYHNLVSDAKNAIKCEHGAQFFVLYCQQ